MMDRIKQIVSYLPTVGILIVLFALPYPYGSMQRFGLYVAAIGYFMDYIINRRWQGWHWRKEYGVFVAFILFYLCIPLHQLIDPMHEWVYQSKIDSYFPFMAIGLMGLLGFNRTIRISYVAPVMILSCLILYGMILWAMRGVPMADLATWQEVLMEKRTRLINPHMVVNVYCNITLVFGAWILLRAKWPQWSKIIVGILMGLIAVGIMLSEGRTGQITLVLLMVLFFIAWLYLAKRYKWIAPALTLVALLAVGGWFMLPRFQHPSMKDNARWYVWQKAKEIIHDKPILGWGVSGARHEFIERGKNDENFRMHYLNEYEYAAKKEYGYVNYDVIHPHSVFLETWMEQGLVGLLLLILCIVLPVLLFPIGRHRWYLASCILVFAIQAFFECMGACLSPIWIPLLTFVWAYNAETSTPSLLQPTSSERT